MSFFRRKTPASGPEHVRLSEVQLDEFAEPIMILDADGGLIAANEAATALGHRLGTPLEDATRIDRLLANSRIVNGGGSPAWAPSSESDGLDALVSATEPSVNERVFELDSVARLDRERRPAGWVVRLIDVTPLVTALRREKAAAGHRDKMLKFLSHDMRTPLAAILATMKHSGLGATPADLREIIEGSAHRALDMVDSHVRLIRAQSSDYRFDELNFCHVLEEVIDASWSSSKAFGVKIVFQQAGDEFAISAHRGSLTDALGELFAELIRTSARGAVLLCALKPSSLRGEGAVTLDIKDTGGDRTAQGRLPTRTGQAAPAAGDRGESEEIGSLDFFRTIISRHSGVFVWDGEPSVGRSVSITIPGAGPELGDF